MILKEKGKKKVRIEDTQDGVDFLIMRNGYQWSGIETDKELLILIRDAINEYLEKMKDD